MSGLRIGYVRVSTLGQNEKRQLEGQVLDRVFVDKASGRNTARPQLTELLRFVRDGPISLFQSSLRSGIGLLPDPSRGAMAAGRGDVSA